MQACPECGTPLDEVPFVDCATHRQHGDQSRPCVLVRVYDWGDRRWCYWDPFGCSARDHVIVEVPRRNDDDEVIPGHSKQPVIGVVSKKQPTPEERAKASKWLVGRIDWDAHRARTALMPPRWEEDDDA